MAQAKDISLLPAYLIVGEDELKRNTALRRLHARISTLGDISFNYDEFNGETAAGEDIVAACNTLPFASPLRLVKVLHVEKLKKGDCEAIVDYLSSPLSSTVLALSAEKLAKNTRLFKACAALGKNAVIDCSPKKRHEMPRMVKAIAKGYGVALTDDGALALLDLVGDNTVLLDAELKKISLSCSDMPRVDGEYIQSMVTRTSEVKPWEFVDAFAAHDLASCMKLWDKMQTRNVYSLISLCTQRIRELIAAQSLAARGEKTQLASVLGVPEWRVKNHFSWSKRFAPGELEDALSGALRAEYKMKSGTDPEEAFLDWVVHVLR